ncbi:MAG: DNA/RNA nuclease SfsA [Desulfovibrio sp.]
MSVLLPFNPPCIEARFVKRYKRFIVDAELKKPDGNVEIINSHTNNTGSMLGLLRQGSNALFSPSDNPKRKLRYTWEAVQVEDFYVGINTLTPNRMLHAAWMAGAIPEMEEYTEFIKEAKVGDSRLDALLTRNEGRSPEDNLWVECKNVTMVEDDVARFPDAVTERGQKHLRELMTLAERGHRVALFFLIQRPDAKCFGPADFIDPEYARLLYEAEYAGVEMWPYVAHVSRAGIALGDRLKLVKQ